MMADNNNNMVQVQLGSFLLTVDECTANSLKDPTVAQKYLEAVRDSLNLSSTVTSASTSVESVNNIAEEEMNVMWKTAKRPTQQDHEATLTFLQLRKEFDAGFADKKRVNNDLWLQIAKKMNEMGYFVGKGIQGRDKCRQKFANLQTTYIKYHEKRKRTGEGKIQTPPYYDEMENILGDKHKINPKIVIDSDIREDEERDVMNTESVKNVTVAGNRSLPSTSKYKDIDLNSIEEHTETPRSSHRFDHIAKKLKPDTPRNAALNELIQIQKENQKSRSEEFSRVMNFLETQSQQRHEQIMTLLTTTKKQKSNQRKSRQSSDESD